MDAARWQRIEDAFHAATGEALGPARDAKVLALCQGDDALAAEVRALLSENDRLITVQEPGDPHIGLRLGHYEIDSLIARGGMAAVYRAHRADDQFQQQVAIKIMDLRLSDPVLVAQFRIERQILATLEHPALTRLLDGGVTAVGEPYLVMEYVEGQPIDQYADLKRLDIPARLQLFAQVCDGVAFAHRTLVLHRDLKPSNILVTEEGRVKVVDFGTATLLEPERLATLSRAPLTPAYASPEQLTGQAVGTASDQFSLGLVLFELLTGAPAFGNRTSLIASIERALAATTTASPHTVVTEAAAAARQISVPRLKRLLSGDVATIVGKALALEPERRFASVQHLADDLQRWTAGEPVLARASGVGYRFRKLVARHKLEAAAASVAVLALVGGLLAAVVQARRADAQSRRATEVTRFLTTMLGSADPGALGKDVTVREILVRASKDAAALDTTPELAAEVRAVIGRTFSGLGDYDAAEQQLTLALAAERKAAPAGSVETARLLAYLSFAQENAGRLDDAARSLDEAAAVLQRRSDVEPSVRANHLDQQGRLLAARGEFETAIRVFTEARQLVRAESLGPEARATAAANLGNVLANRGRYREAAALYAEAVEVTGAAEGPQSMEVADMLSPYASVLWFAGERQRAMAAYERALAIRREALGPEHPNYAVTLSNYVDSLIVLERYEQAVSMAREILALRGNTLPDTHTVVPYAMMLLGRALGPLGQLDEAERWLREGLALRQRSLPDGHWSVASARSIIGGHLVLAKRFAEAERMLVDSERELEAALGNESPIVADTRKRLADLYTAWNRPADASGWRRRLPAQTP